MRRTAVLWTMAVVMGLGASGAHAQSTPARALSIAVSDALSEFVARAQRLVVLTGAGCSTESGIPDYRSPGGALTRRPPGDHPGAGG